MTFLHYCLDDLKLRGSINPVDYGNSFAEDADTVRIINQFSILYHDLSTSARHTEGPRSESGSMTLIARQSKVHARLSRSLEGVVLMPCT